MGKETFVANIKRIRQGDGSLNIEFSRGGELIEGFICTLFVKQFTSDTAIITRELAASDERTWSDLLTTTETATLKVGLWHAFGVLSDAVTKEGRGIADGDVRFMVQPGLSDPAAVATPIISVSSGNSIPSGGNFARFNFAAGPTFTVGQQLVLSGYVTNTLYNDTVLIVAANTTFIEVTSLTTFLAIKFGTNEATGSISS